MKRKIVTILLTLSMVLGSVLTPLEIKAKTEVSDRQSVEWNGNTCGYQVVLPEGYDPDGGMRYPVMYLLPDDGLGEYPEGMEDMLGETMSGEKGIDMILVKPAFTLDMDVRQVMELVAADVDAKYNTIPGAGNRAVVGTGAGGYLAYILGLTETKQADDQEPAEDAKDPEESADTKTGQEDLDKTAGEIPDTDSDTPQETLDSRDVEEALDAEKESDAERSDAGDAEKESNTDRSDVRDAEKGSDAEHSDAGDAEKESNANRSDVRDAEKETDVNRSDVQDNEKELDARQLEAGKESDAEQKPDASQAELQSPAKDSDADTSDFDKDSVTDMPKQQDSEKNAEADAEKTGNAEDSTGADFHDPDSGSLPEESDADMPKPLESDSKAIDSVPLTAPGTFGMIASIRGDFVSSDNPWYEIYGDVYDYLVQCHEADPNFYTRFYTYMDAPAGDAWTNMAHSTSDMGALFISWEKSISFDYHEFTVRTGSYSTDYLQESLERVVSRMTNRFISGLASGSVSLKKAALTGNDKTAEVSYSIEIGEKYADFFQGGNSKMDITVAVLDPNTKEILYDTTISQNINGPGTYEGGVKVPNKVNKTSSTIQMYVNLLGVRMDLDTATLIRIQDTGDAEDEQQIDLMGDWYFNYVGLSDPFKADTLTSEEYESWSVVQPALGNWEQGFGNITKIWYMNTGWGWYARTFELPEDFTKENLTLLIGYMDDRGEVFVNGKRIGGTGVNEDGSSTKETTWAVLSKFSIDSSILNYGGTNTVYVHVYNDPPYGGGGWYSGPVGLYSQAAYNKLQGLPSRVPEKEIKESVAAAAAYQNTCLKEGRLEEYAGTIAEDYFSSGNKKEDRVKEAEELIHDKGITEIEDTGITIFETEDKEGTASYLYSAERKITFTDGSVQEIKFQDTYISRNDRIYMYGNHSRFFETSYDSAYAASATEKEGTVEEKYLVYLPEGYFESDRNYPTTYLLHQFNSDHTSYMTDNVDRLLDEAIEEGLIDEMIVVIPNSEEDSWWRDDWEKMVTDEMVPMMDARYRTIRDARYRLTAGASMGGQGAYGLALRNPDIFSGAVSFFGAFSMGGAYSPNEIVKEVSTEYLQYFSMYFMCGNQDLYGFGVPAIQLDAALTERGVDHCFFIENGDHNSEFYIPYFKSAFSYVRGHMYQADDEVTEQISGTAVLENKDGKTVVNTSIKIEDGISSYMNRIPASVYTKNENPSLSVPVMLEVTQGGKTVYTASQRDYMTDGAADESFSFDITDSIDPDEAYQVSLKAAVFDKTVELAQTSAEKKDDGKDPGDDGKDPSDDSKDPGDDGNKGTDDGKDDGTGGDDKKPGTKPSGQGNDTGSGSKGTKTTGAGNAKTGDETPVVLYLTLTAAAFGGVILILKKKKQIRKS
ncbi:alpha/beta hydrolase-fold protein [Blautia sp. JLR.GB0024]|uniref:alpha/beta hydrolase-fold protein n=1 Tax=Blautia sp. JLR.GB0024 TaxID=3123295 RepID=UPI003005B6DD